MGNNPSNHQPLERGVSRFGDVNTRRSLRSPRKMDRLRRSFRDSFRRRKDRQPPESSRPHVWQADEAAVRAGTCTFHVKYLGCVEVFESRGMQVCEEALKVLRASRRRPVRALLHISGDGLRVVEDETKGLIVDQTIEKVSFCAPDRNHERGFSYICRDGTTRRWMAHGFLSLRDSGERLSHAVGCAFSACLERKQRRDKECAVTMTFDQQTNSFTRQGSFRTSTMTESNNGDNKRVKNPPVNPFAIERPHATPHMLERQGSFRGLGQLGNNSPFKRQMSLRVTDLPSNTERLKQFIQNKPVSPIPETDSVTQLCVQLTQGLSALTNSDDFNFNSQNSINQNVFPENFIEKADPVNFHEQRYPVDNFSDPINRPSSNLSDQIRPLTEISEKTQQISLKNDHGTLELTNQQVNQSRGDVIGPIDFNMALNQSTPNKKTDNIENLTPKLNFNSGLTESGLNQTFNASSAGNAGLSNASETENRGNLPNPEQWLSQIGNKSSSPNSTFKGAPIRKAPMLGPHSRTMSLGTAEAFGKIPGQNDPFDAEWAALATRGEGGRSTNPFLSGTSPQPFQVRL